jgi:2-polyprenyl-3-methyl-5-hydroxy-6-metoxy-1,4-benzoquinol methylase
MGDLVSVLMTAGHWEGVYEQREPEQLSWFEDTPETSLAWIDRTDIALDAAILDAGGGASQLAAGLVERGHTDVTVADISSAALETAKAQTDAAGDRITWVQADLRSHTFDRQYDLWHDRAVFHFMVDAADRDGYLDVLRASIRAGGHLILATFGPHGPEQCSNLPVRRYSAEEAAALLADDFDLVDSDLTDHPTPGGSVQQFMYAWLRRRV